MFNEKKFFEKFPKDVYDICVYISRQGFCLSLVGGAVRDFLLNSELSKDLDFEIKHLFEYSPDRWERMLIRMFSGLEKDLGCKVEHKGLNVFSIQAQDCELEFSSPRIEEFDLNDKSHKNFTPKFISNLSTDKAFIRRDFTINAIGIYFGVSGATDEFTVLDPFDGINDLKQGILRHVGDDFSKDPVRLLRLVRFKNRFNLDISDSTLAECEAFDLSRVSAHYVRTEFYKLGNLNFFKDLFILVDKKGISLNSELEKLRVLSCSSNESLAKFSIDNFVEWLCLHEKIDESSKLSIVKYFGLPLKYSQKLIQLSLNYKNLDDGNIATYTEFFMTLFSLDLKSEITIKWNSYRDEWISSLKSFRPLSKSSAKSEREVFLENLTKKILDGN